MKRLFIDRKYSVLFGALFDGFDVVQIAFSVPNAVLLSYIPIIDRSLLPFTSKTLPCSFLLTFRLTHSP
jgi:hypothetical protein